MPRRWVEVFRSAELRAFVGVWAAQFITYWFSANIGVNPTIAKLGSSAINSTPPKPNPTQVPPVPQNGVGGVVAVATHPVLLHYALQIFLTNLGVMLISSIPLIGFVYGEYVAFKLGATVNYYVNDPGLNTGHLSALVVIGALLTQPFYYLETFGFALGCSAGLLGGVTLFRPARRRLVWFFSAIAISTVLLFVAALLEATLILHFD